MNIVYVIIFLVIFRKSMREGQPEKAMSNVTIKFCKIISAATEIHKVPILIKFILIWIPGLVELLLKITKIEAIFIFDMLMQY